MRKTKLFVEVKSVTDLEGNRRSDPPYEGIYDYPGYVPLIEVDSVMLIMDCEMALTRLTTTKVQSYSFNEDTRTHIVRTKNSIYALQDYYNPKARKRANDLKKCEAKIAQLEEELTLLEETMALPENASSSAKLLDLTKEQSQKTEELNLLYEQWEELAEE